MQIELPRLEAWIGGKWVDTGKRFDVVNPATTEKLAEVADCGPSEAAAAIEAADKAFASWRKTTAYERTRILRRFYELMRERKEYLARLIAAEMGKPVREARGEIDYAAGFVEWYAEEAKRIYGDMIPASVARKRILVQMAPVGPVLGVTPWNFPAAMVTRKLAPALAAGCTFILKPAKQSPLTALGLAGLLEEAGTPAGVAQVLTTSQSGPLVDVLLDDARIRKLTFTGSTETGALLEVKAAKTMKRISLELGGHAPVIVFADADLEQAAAQTIACKFRAAGQTCVCANRIYVQDTVVEPFLAAFTEQVRKLRVGLPLAEETEIGPLVDAQALAKVTKHVNEAVAGGARIVLGGRPIDKVDGASGYYFAPTILAGVKPSMLVAREETFGPVAPIFTFRDEEEALCMANDTIYGLAAYFFTKDIGRMFRVSEGLDFGIIGVNDGVPSTPQAPFGGMKASGMGREGGRYGIEEYIERKYLSIAIS